ncbi:hypothetical protein LINPERHAP2_LOCUS24139 [Linum perenne]
MASLFKSFSFDLPKLAYENKGFFGFLSMFCSVFIILFNVLDVFHQWGTEVPVALKISALAIPVHAIFTAYYISSGDRSWDDYMFHNWFVKATVKIVVLCYNVYLNVLVLNAHIKHEYMFIFCLYMFSASLYVRLPVDMSVSSTSIATTAAAVWGCRGWTSHPVMLVAALFLLLALKNYLSEYKPSKECSIPKTIVQ